jgi:hypothetical protein
MKQVAVRNIITLHQQLKEFFKMIPNYASLSSILLNYRETGKNRKKNHLNLNLRNFKK